MSEQGELILSDPRDQLNEIINALNLDKVILLFYIFYSLRSEFPNLKNFVK